jgi:hypothetical protein
MFLRRKGARVAILAVLAIAATSGYALTSGFTATNTIAQQKVGAGSANSVGYTVSNIVYTFNDTNLAKVDAVEFDLSASADNVKVQLTTSAGAPSGTVYDCALSGTVSAGGGSLSASSTHPVCDLGGVANSTITKLTVAATELTP